MCGVLYGTTSACRNKTAGKFLGVKTTQPQDEDQGQTQGNGLSKSQACVHTQAWQEHAIVPKVLPKGMLTLRWDRSLELHCVSPGDCSSCVCGYRETPDGSADGPKNAVSCAPVDGYLASAAAEAAVISKSRNPAQHVNGLV